MLDKKFLTLTGLLVMVLNPVHRAASGYPDDFGRGNRMPFYTQHTTWADSLLSTMSVEEKIGQLFMIGAYSNRDETHIKEVEALIRDWHVGGLIFFQGGPVRQARMNNRFQDAAKVPLMVAMDAEWGPGMRLDSTITYPRQLGMGAIRDDDVVYRFGSEVGRQLKRLGVHINFAPVIDVNNNPNNPVIGDRSFGEDRYNVARKGLAYMDGLQDQRVLACGKHFPGHGDTDVDSHHGLPVIKHDWERLDSVELYPFKVLMRQGLGSVMTAHLNIPALDPATNRASSISPAISSGLLRDSLGFQGLVFTDALNMKGVADYVKPGELEVQSFKAGNDILLFSQDVPTASRAMRTAVTQGKISIEDLDTRVLRILNAKAWMGLDSIQPVQVEDLIRDLNNSEARWTQREICERRLTLLHDSALTLPLRGFEDPSRIAFVDLGRSSSSRFQKTLSDFGEFPMHRLPGSAKQDDFDDLYTKLGERDTVVVALHEMSRYAIKRYGLSDGEVQFVQRVAARQKVILVVFGSPYALSRFERLESLNDPILVAYDEKAESQEAAARGLFGSLRIDGRLPVGAGSRFKAGDGDQLLSQRLKPSSPQEVGLSEEAQASIDSVMKHAIEIGATPGGHILLALNGKIFLDNTYGHHTYTRKRSVQEDDLYDLASITKIASTTLALMKLYEDSLIDLDKKVLDYLPNTEGSDVGSRQLRDILTHTAGLQPWIPFYLHTLQEDGTINENYYRAEPEGPYQLQVAENLWLHHGWEDSVWRRIKESELRRRRDYKYSDLGFYIFRRLVEQVSGMPLDEYVHQHFYQPLGLRTMCYRPLERFPSDQIIPSEEDSYFRQQKLQGYVHDMGAAMMGGVEGHAGLFSNAEDLAVLMQMLMNGGHYGGLQFLNPETITLFTAKQKKDVRRGLGFDKPELNPNQISPTSLYCSPYTFGHSGFTGTCTWADPQFGLVYVFLSNRVFPSMDNHKLISENVRTAIQDIVYEDLFYRKETAGRVTIH